MLWLLLIIALIVIFGLGTLLKATFWVLVIIAAAVIIFSLAVSRVIDK